MQVARRNIACNGSWSKDCFTSAIKVVLDFVQPHLSGRTIYRSKHIDVRFNFVRGLVRLG